MKHVLRRWIVGMLALGLVLAFGSSSFAHQHGTHKEKKVGILLVAFGSSEASAQVSFENIDRKAKAAWPDVPVYWAYTSRIIRHKLAGQEKPWIPRPWPWPTWQTSSLPMWRYRACIPLPEQNTMT